MLLSWIDNLECYIWPDKVLLVKYRRLPKPHVQSRQWLHAKDGYTLKDLLAELRGFLKKPQWQSSTKVILCGELVHYRLVKHDPRLNDAEFLLLAKHQFELIYGNAVNNRQVYLQSTRYNRNSLAVAVDKTFVEEVKTLFANTKATLMHIRPSVVEWLNQVRREIPRTGWIVLNDGYECVLLKIQDAELQLYRRYAQKTADAEWMTQMLAREALSLGEELDGIPVRYFRFVDGLLNRDRHTENSIGKPKSSLGLVTSS